MDYIHAVVAAAAMTTFTKTDSYSVKSMKYEKGNVIICDAMFDRTKRRLREQRGGSTGLHLHRTKSQGLS